MESKIRNLLNATQKVVFNSQYELTHNPKLRAKKILFSKFSLSVNPAAIEEK